jgi:ELWxxDGT repeat protein
MKLKIIFALCFLSLSFMSKAQIPALVKDIDPGTSFGLLTGITPHYYNGVFVFVAFNTTSGNELWRTDGTSNGTYLIKDINSGTASSYPAGFFEFNGELFFIATTAANGKELWKTNGTTGGTVLVKDILVGSISGLNTFYVVWQHNSSFYFTASSTSTTNIELWKSDGTNAGTSLVKDIYPGTTGSYPSGFIEFNNELYFAATDATNGEELWKTNGSTAGTILVKDIYTGTSSGVTNFVSRWQKNGFMYFIATSGATTDYELWKTDGTNIGTTKLKDINSGTSGSNPTSFYEFDNELFFSADNGIIGRELYKTDGTTIGTVLLKDINPGATGGISSFNVYWLHNGFFYFIAASITNDFELWKSDGTTAGTTKLKDINSGSAGSNCNYFYEFNNQLYFSADNGSIGKELWKTDGTTAGTVLVKDIFPGADDGLVFLSPFWEHNGFFFFAARDLTVNNLEIWKSNGTTAGTTKLKDILPGNSSSTATNFYEFNNQLYFAADDGVNGKEFWKTDGTTAGTVLVKDICVGASNESIPEFFATYNGYMYFTAATSANLDREIWKSDGTTAGTSLVMAIYPGTTGSNPFTFNILNNTYLLFCANSPSAGRELWAFNMAGIANGVEAAPQSINVSVFPNPAKDLLNINASESGLMIQLFDLSGKLMKELISDQNSTKLDVSDYSSGLYFLRCRNKSSIINRKIVLE